MVTYHHLWVGYYFLFKVEANWHPLFKFGQQLADQFLCMVDTCNRLGGHRLGLTEEVEDVGDLHRGELLAVLAIPFASTLPGNFKASLGHAFFYAFLISVIHKGSSNTYRILILVIQEVQSSLHPKAGNFKDCYRFPSPIIRRRERISYVVTDFLMQESSNKTKCAKVMEWKE